jgi:hypothetical protein
LSKNVALSKGMNHAQIWRKEHYRKREQQLLKPKTENKLGLFQGQKNATVAAIGSEKFIT